MAERIQIDLGALPWEPSPSAKLLKTYDYYDMPLAGLIDQDGVFFAFWALEGQAEEYTLWAYTALNPKLADYLDNARDIDQALASLMTHEPPPTIAVSREGTGIISFADLDEMGLPELGHQAVLDETLGRSLLTSIERRVREGDNAPALSDAIHEIRYLSPDQTKVTKPSRPGRGSPQIFISYSREDSETAKSVVLLIEQLVMDADVTAFEYGRITAGQMWLDELEQRLAAASFAILLMPSEDRVRSSKDMLTYSNVLFELGFLVGRLGNDRVAALVERGSSLRSNTDSRIYLTLDRRHRWRRSLANALAKAGLPVEDKVGTS
jgi:predicted nucleotide-binding protein